jgi:methylase of polypeptide subunit release factors
VATAADHLSRSERRALGAVYTPAGEAELACELALARWKRDPAGAVVCDPACGAGDFLAAFVRCAGAPVRMVGVDADRGALARVQVPGAELHHGDALVTDPGTFAWGVHAPARYDLVVGNPPYVRHQSLTDPLGRSGRYADRVAAAVAALAPGLRLSRRADLAAAFLVLGASLLARNGVLAFVTTSAWLDAAYGAPLGRHLLDAGLVELVERPAERTFAAADVNSLIVVVRRGADGDVVLRQLGRPDRRVPRHALAAAPKWGGPLLRAPAAAPLLARGVPLGSACRVGSYLITGCDAFFYRSAADGIDPACLRPVVKSTRGRHHILLDEQPGRWLVSAADPARLGAEAEAAVAAGIPELSGVRARRVWSAIEQEPAPVLAVRTARDRHLTYLNPHGFASGEFYRLWPPDGVAPAALAAFLQSAVAGLQLEALGRAYGGGGGPLKVERADLVQLRIPTADQLRGAADALVGALAPLLRRPVGTVPEERGRTDRDALEHLCGRLFGLSEDETEAVRDAHAAAVAARVGRAQRVLAG